MPQGLPKETPRMSRQAGYTQPKVVFPYATFAWWISPCKKSKKLMNYFQQY